MESISPYRFSNVFNANRFNSISKPRYHLTLHLVCIIMYIHMNLCIRWVWTRSLSGTNYIHWWHKVGCKKYNNMFWCYCSLVQMVLCFYWNSMQVFVGVFSRDHPVWGETENCIPEIWWHCSLREFSVTLRAPCLLCTCLLKSSPWRIAANTILT